ncbi:MAG: hypothetical protein AB1324_06080 [Candidatus Micrarchaeota archaeon]
MMYTAVFMFIAIGAFVVVTDLQQSEVPLQQNTVAKETGEGFVTVITLAVKGGEGFSYNYTFSEMLFSSPYLVNFSNLNDANSTILLEWPSSYGVFSYRYDVPKYSYRMNGTCLADFAANSSDCSNVLNLYNDGENLTITQLP